MEESSTTVALQGLLDRFAAGDEAAKQALIARALDRLSAIARKLLRGFGGEGRLEMWTTDVFNEAYPRLSKALEEVKPGSVPQFLGLARLQMQRALLDHVRAIEGRNGVRGPRPVALSGKEDSSGGGIDPPDQEDYERQRVLALDLLDAISKLPENEAETVWLKLGGHTHREIGELLGVHKDTIDRYWTKACIKLAKPLTPYLDRLGGR